MIRDPAIRAAKALIAADQREKRQARKREANARPKVEVAAIAKTPRIHDKAYLAFIRRQPCCACGASAPTHAAHVRHGYPEAGWRSTGMQEKPNDRRTLPLCPGCHVDGPNAQHRSNERAWWRARGIYPPDLCATYERLFEGQPK